MSTSSVIKAPVTNICRNNFWLASVFFEVLTNTLHTCAGLENSRAILKASQSMWYILQLVLRSSFCFQAWFMMVLQNVSKSWRIIKRKTRGRAHGGCFQELNNLKCFRQSSLKTQAKWLAESQNSMERRDRRWSRYCFWSVSDDNVFCFSKAVN